MISPFADRNATVSFYFGGNQKTGFDPSKQSTAIKHSPIVPASHKLTAGTKNASAKQHSKKSVKKVEDIRKQDTNYTKPFVNNIAQENIPDKKINHPTKGAENSAKQATNASKQTKSSSKLVQGDIKATRNVGSQRNLPTRSQSKRPRAKWSSVEDQRMIRVLESIVGEDFKDSDLKVNWSDVAVEMNTGRNAKQCRDRWMNYLRPGLKKGEWDEKEEKLIKEMYDNFGPKWCAMAKLLPYRAENDIKNKWYSMMRKQKRSQDKLSAEINAWTDCPSGEDLDVDWNHDDEDWDSSPSLKAFKSKPGGKDLSRLLAVQAADVHHV